MITPPWYRTPWAYLAASISAIAFFILVVRIYSWRLVASRNKLQRIVKQQTAEVVRQKNEIEQQRDQIESANQALWGEMALHLC